MQPKYVFDPDDDAPLGHDTHVAPPFWGFKTFGFPACYKHVAPLGLKTGNTRPLYIWHPAGALRLLGFLRAINMSPRWG